MDKKESLNSKIEKFVKLFAEVDREFIPPDLGGGESHTQDGEGTPVGEAVTTRTDILCECAQEVPWNVWINLPAVKSAVISECTSCATNWTPTCDCIAKGAVARGVHPAPAGQPGETNIIGGSLRDSPLGRLVQVCDPMLAYIPCHDNGRGRVHADYCCSFIKFNGGCFPDGDAFDYVYTKEQWLGSASAPTINGAWVSYFERCRQRGYPGPSAEEFLANCNDLTGTNCMEQFTQYYGTMWHMCSHQLGTGSYMSLDRGPTKYAKMLFDNCGSAGGACCTPEDFGGFNCSSVTNSDSCAGTFHPGKTCQDIGDNNCGGAPGGNLLGQNQIDKSVVNEISASLIKALRKKA